ncbi:unnamed protein product [Allacma fusca]|uniref:Uncharacterized protein n=1 Tax=Allacma fusca TaxID=39272 RepID=A0A8J2K892_9HEXA|nr:unnamed protein product [Allacma fusca]
MTDRCVDKKNFWGDLLRTRFLNRSTEPLSKLRAVDRGLVPNWRVWNDIVKFLGAGRFDGVWSSLLWNDIFIYLYLWRRRIFLGDFDVENCANITSSSLTHTVKVYSVPEKTSALGLF